MPGSATPSTPALDEVIAELRESVGLSALSREKLRIAEAARADLVDLRAEMLEAMKARPAPADEELPVVATLADVEKSHCLRVLAMTGGRVVAAAKSLGVGQATLYRRLQEWGVSTKAEAV